MTETMDLGKDFSDDDDDIIELTDILEDVSDGGDDSHGPSGDGVSAREGVADNSGAMDDDAIEAALLRIVEKKYAQRLDALFIEAVERVVEREIAVIKQSLIRDLS